VKSKSLVSVLAFVVIFGVGLAISYYDIPGQRNKKISPLDLLQQRFASGQIIKEEYQERKNILISDNSK